MKLQDLRNGMIVVNSKNSVGIVLKGTEVGDLILWCKNITTQRPIFRIRSLWTINNDLSFKDGTGRIIGVHQPKEKTDYCDFDLENCKLLYPEVVREVTMDEVERQFGCRVKIKK